MNMVKETNEFGLNICLYEDKKCLSFIYGENGDLYWSINSSNGDFSFDIKKDNLDIYVLFERLFDDIENININDKINVPLYLETDEEKLEYINEYKKRLERDKVKYRKFNFSNYNELFDKENNTITWHSDETAHEVSNVLKIKKYNDLFKLNFFVQPYIEGYDRDFNSSIYIPIRFSNSGSFYQPFNNIFMRMYNDMKNIVVDDFEQEIFCKEKVKKMIR